MVGRRVIVKVPASTANLGPGFDTLGMALSLYAWVDMSIAEHETTITVHGDNLGGVATDKSNLIYKVAQLVFKEAGVEIPELTIAMYSEIPLARGLGSSAAAIIGALVAANYLAGSPLSDAQLFQMANRLEGHPDNVGAALYGGIVVAACGPDGEARHIRLQPHPQLQALVAIPAFRLPTEQARHALPKEVSMADAVFNTSHSSLLVAAFASGNLEMIRHAMQDRLHHPYRAPLIPAMPAILAGATSHGALGVALSGAGPTLIAFVDSQSGRKDELAQFLLKTLQQEGIEAQAQWLWPSEAGPECIAVDAGHAGQSLMELIKGEVWA